MLNGLQGVQWMVCLVVNKRNTTRNLEVTVQKQDLLEFPFNEIT